MSLKSNIVISFFGVALGSLTPFTVAYAVTAPPPPPSAGAEAGAIQSAEHSTAPAPQLVAKPGKQTRAAEATTQPTTPQAFSWSGPYIGVFTGGAWATSSLTTHAGYFNAASYFASAADVHSVSQSGSGTVSPKSALAGIQIGNSVQSGNMVYGAILDYSSFRLDRSVKATNVPYPSFPTLQYRLKTSMSTTWMASLRARLGYVPSSAWPLMYVTGGLAITNLHVFNTFSDNAPSKGFGGATSTKIKAGWDVGVGVEMPIRGNWTVDGEYQYINFGSNSANGYVRSGISAFRSPFSTSANLTTSLFKIGLNYKLS